MTALEERIRSHYQAVADDLKAPPLDRAFPARRARRRHQNRMAALVVTAALGLGGVGAALSTLDSDRQVSTQTVDQPNVREDEPLPITTEPAPRTTEASVAPAPHIDASSAVTMFDYRDDPFADLAAADDGESLWAVSSPDAAPGQVTRLDPETGEVIARIALPGGARTFGVLVGVGAVWVPASDGYLHRIDPATNAWVASVQIPTDQPQGWFAGGAATTDAVWVGEAGDPRVLGTPMTVVWRVDPVSNTVVESVPIQGAIISSSIGVGDGAVWVADGVARRVDRIDPETNEVVAQVSSPGEFSGLDVVADGDSVWMIGSRWAARIDPGTNEIVATVTLPPISFGAVLVDGSLFVGSAARLRFAPGGGLVGGDTLSRIDTSTMMLDATIDLGPDGPEASNLALTEDYLWFRDSDRDTRLGRVPIEAIASPAG